LTEPASNIPAITPPRTAVPKPASAMTAIAPMSMVSSRSFERMNGARALPVIVSRLAKPSERPNHTRPASWARNQKNRWKKVKPALALNSNIAFEARFTRSECNSARSSRPAVPAAITSRGSRVAATKANPKMAAAYNSVASAPTVFCSIAAGMIAIAPIRPEIRPNFELASTNSSSVRTTVGTSALLEMAYVFCATIATKASGNSNKLVALNAIRIDSPTRTIVMIWITNRRPPAIRSIAGPISGATNRNGTKLIPRNSSTRPRAASASRLNNTESARATAIAASPAAIAAWVRARRLNLDSTGVARAPDRIPGRGAGRRLFTWAS
jgi:hypothetical protein